MDLNKIIDEYTSSSNRNQKYAMAEKFVEMLKGYKIIIYGAGAAGRSLLAALRMHKIEPVFFVDRRYCECPEVEGVSVQAPDTLAELSGADNNLAVLFAINTDLLKMLDKEPMERLEKLHGSVEILYAGIDATRMLKEMYCGSKLQQSNAFSLIECLECGGESKLCDVYLQYLKQIAVGRRILTERPSRKFEWFGYIMGQFCSLKCKDCCEHVPYYQNPVFSSCETVLADCEKIAASCEFIRYIELIGGEPFMNPEFKCIIEGLLTIENVGYIKIFTNATIVPSDDVLQVLKNPRVVVHISNYTAQAKGTLLENIYATRKRLQECGIRYIFQENHLWSEWGDFHDRGKTEEELAYNFSHCFCPNARVFQGVIYRCPHQYAGIQRGLMEYTEGEYIDLHQCTVNELAEKLDAFEELPFTDGCRRCDMPFDCPMVPAGVQL